ncbi:conserved hypothetical protein [Desulfosarcina cetonica]|nr:conserved hypothetical protein [Desulfosarcina cetonica]
MKTSLRLCHGIALMGFVMLILTTTNVFAQKVVRLPLERPALMSENSEKATLLCVARAGHRILAAGERGIIVFSDDDGKSWIQANVPVSVTLTNIRFATPKKGWAVGHSGVVLYSENGGESWVLQLEGHQAAALMMEAAKATAKAFPADMRAQQAVANAELFVQDGPDKPFLDIYMVDARKGFIVGAYNMIFYTEDGGESWQPWQDHVENPEGLHLYSILPMGGYIFMAGERGLFLRSEDQGQSFHKMPTPYEGTYFGLLAVANNRLLIFGLKGNVFRSDDYGNSWQKIDAGVSVALTAGAELKDGTCVLTTQYGDVLISHDQANTFSKLTLEGEVFPLMGIVNAYNRNLVVVGTRGVKVIPVSSELASATKKDAGE